MGLLCRNSSLVGFCWRSRTPQIVWRFTLGGVIDFFASLALFGVDGTPAAQSFPEWLPRENVVPQ
jgi:hypothetical protein